MLQSPSHRQRPVQGRFTDLHLHLPPQRFRLDLHLHAISSFELFHTSVSLDHNGTYWPLLSYQPHSDGEGRSWCVCCNCPQTITPENNLKKVFEFIVCWNKVALSLYSLNILVSDNLYGVNNIFDHSGHDISDFLTQHDWTDLGCGLICSSMFCSKIWSMAHYGQISTKNRFSQKKPYLFIYSLTWNQSVGTLILEFHLEPK